MQRSTIHSGSASGTTGADDPPTRRRQLGRRGGALAMAALLPLGLLTACNRDSKSSDSASKSNPNSKDCTYYLVSFQGPVNTFMAAEQKGVQQAAKDFGIKAVFEGPSSFSVPDQLNLLKSAAANKPCGIATGLADPTALTQPIKAILADKVPVVLWNVQDFTNSDPEIGALAYVGQDETQSGATLAKRLIPKLKKGDHVVFGVDTPGELVARMRFDGLKTALSAAGISTTLLNVGDDPTAGVGILQSYLAKNPNIQAIVSNAATTAQAAALYVQQNNVKGKYVVAGFDMASPIVNAIKSGYQDFALDQQPYLQGYFAIQELYLEHEKGFQPVNINSGTFFVDKTNVADFETLTKQGVGA